VRATLVHAIAATSTMSIGSSVAALWESIPSRERPERRADVTSTMSLLLGRSCHSAAAER